MFEDIGEKLKSAAYAVMVISIITCLFFGAILIYYGATAKTVSYESSGYISNFSMKTTTSSDPNYGMVTGGICTIIFGIYFSVVLGRILYGFGENIHTNQAILSLLKKSSEKKELSEKTAASYSVVKSVSDENLPDF